MKRIHLHLAALLLSAAALPAAARQHPADTLRVSDIFTTHIVFNTDLIYADLSNSQACVGKILEQSRNMIALKARSPFATPLSVSALESNGTMHTFIVLFEENPRELVYDIREAVPREPADAPAARRRATGFTPGCRRKCRSSNCTRAVAKRSGTVSAGGRSSTCGSPRGT